MSAGAEGPSGPPRDPKSEAVSPDAGVGDDASDEARAGDETADARGRERATYRERKAESDALARLARALVELPPARLGDVPLPAELRAQVEICRGFRKGPRVRQLRRVSQLLRRLGGEAIEAVEAAALDAGHRQRQRAQRERIYEHWRQRLLTEGDRALAELVDAHPSLDAQRLRQWLRQAQRDPEGARGAQARRKVLRAIRAAMEGGEPPAEA
ncbi:MAG: ribosome biogenesis factor YjgA [Myxococcota bacterium]